MMTPSSPVVPKSAVSMGGSSRYKGMRKSTWRVSSRIAAFIGWPLDWK